MNYYYFMNDDEFCYTIDMVRFKTYLSRIDAKAIRLFLSLNCDNYFIGHGYGKFTDNWKIGNIWFGLGSLSKTKDGNIIFCIEFNPNKLDKKCFEFLKVVLFKYDFHVTRYDLAIDIPYNINQLYFGSLSKRSYSLFYTDYDNKTYYFGKGNGHTKIYNKKIESGLDFELTRYEVTCECDFKFGDKPIFTGINFISVCRCPYFSLSTDETLDAVLYAVNCGFPYKSLSRRYKDYIKKDLIRIV